MSTDTPDVNPNDIGVTDRATTIEEQIAAVEIECKYRQTKIRQAARMKDVVQLANVDIRGDLVSRANEIRGLKALQQAAEARLRELIGGHLLELRNMRDLGLLIQMRSHYQHREWGYLKAIQPMLFREADAEAERIERRLERESDQTRGQARRSR